MPVVFFVLTYALAWACFFSATGAGAMQTPIILIGVFAPSIIAIALTLFEEGTAGVAAMFRRMFRANVGVRWYVFAVAYMAAVKLAVALIHRVAFGEWPRFGTDRWFIIIAAIVLSWPVQAGEEIGWRGYALPRLASRFGFAASGVILGIVWAAWHLPFFFISVGGDQTGQSFPVYLLQVTALSVAITFLYVRTSGSVLLTMLMHSAVNQTKDIVPSIVPGATDVFAFSSSISAWLTVCVLWASAAYFLVRMPPPTSAPAVALSRGAAGSS